MNFNFIMNYPKVIEISSDSPRRISAKNLCNIPTLLDAYLCFHGLSYAGKFEFKCKKITLFIVSDLFIILNEMNKIYNLIFAVHSNYSNPSRIEIIAVTIIILEYMLILLYCFKKNKIQSLNSSDVKSLLRHNSSENY